MTTYKGKVFYNQPCSECRDVIHIATMRKNGKFLCDRCHEPRTPSCGNGNTGQPHWDDDPSGASGSWDQVVALYEGE